MVDTKFNNKMSEILRSMKDKTFKSYEYESLDKWGNPYGCVRFNLGRYAVDLTNFVQEIDFFGKIEDIPVFKCEKKELSDPFCMNTDTVANMVDEVIKEVSIVTDLITVEDYDYSIAMDRAVIIKCEYNYYVFYKEWYYGEMVFIRSGKEMPSIYPIEKVAFDWGDYGEHKTTVKRTTRCL